MAGAKNHDYHILNPSWWPFLGSLAGFIMLVGAVFMFHDNGPWMFLIGLVGVLYVMFGWWSECVTESHQGDHTPVVQIGLRYGVILFIMLVGLPPWEFARAEDPRYRMVTKGRLAHMLNSWQRPISPLAADLLQKMLMEDPRQRLSLTEVKDHPWVLEDDSEGAMPQQGGDEGWRG